MSLLSRPARNRLSRIGVTALLGAGLAATCAAASPAGTAQARTASIRSTSATTTTATPAGQSTALIRANVAHRLGVQSAATTPAGYDPADLRSAYNLASAAAAGGKGATVAIISAGDDPTANSDLAVYRAQYGLPACNAASGCLTKVNDAGQASPLPATGYQVAGVSMDVDLVSAICPHCRILLVEADPDAAGSDIGPAVDSAVSLGAKYVIFSASDDSYSSPVYDAEYFDHPGVAIVAPAGDLGFEQAGARFNFPATSPFVTSVGGTTLTRASNARGWTETVWGPSNADDYRGTSSQCTLEYGKPSWQTDAGCAGRTDNDVSAVANPATGIAFYDTTDAPRGWNVGGTTAAASIVGAVYALAGPPARGTFRRPDRERHQDRARDVRGQQRSALDVRARRQHPDIRQVPLVDVGRVGSSCLPGVVRRRLLVAVERPRNGHPRRRHPGPWRLLSASSRGRQRNPAGAGRSRWATG